MASIGMVAYFINYSTEQTSKVSFKAAGLQYRKHFTFTETSSLPGVTVGEKQHQIRSSSELIVHGKSQNSTKKNSLVAKTEQAKTSTKSVLTTAEKESEAKENLKASTDLQVISSFDCVKSIPTVLLDYMSTMFLNEYGQSHTDFHSQYRIDETLPLLKQFNISCGIDQNCSTLFQYDKQYGLSTTADNTFLRKEVFYCCPSVHSSENETISNICKRAQKIAGKSVFRESKDSTFLGWVIKVVFFIIRSKVLLTF